MVKDIQDRQNLNQTIFYIWNHKSGTFQADSTFEHLFKVAPSYFSDIKHLIFNDDLFKLESMIKESFSGKNVTLSLRIKTYNQDYAWFTTCFGRLDGDILVGTLEAGNNDKCQHDKETFEIMHERMQFALQSAQAGLWDWDATTGKVYYDPQYHTMLGYQPGELPNTVAAWSERVHPDDYEKSVQMQLNCIEGQYHGDSFSCKYRFRKADGNYRWIHGHGLILNRDANGKALRLVGLHIDITKEEEANLQLEFMAIHDVLTGLHNRYYFERKFAKLDKTVLPAAYILVDADGLKMVNDCINHLAGDAMLRKLAETLHFSIRNSDMLARIGGDEFGIFLPRTTEPNALNVLLKIIKKIEASNQANRSILLCASLGLACATTMEELATISMRADASMVEHKNKQRKESLIKIKKWIESTGQNYKNYTDKRKM